MAKTNSRPVGRGEHCELFFRGHGKVRERGEGWVERLWRGWASQKDAAVLSRKRGVGNRDARAVVGNKASNGLLPMGPFFLLVCLLCHESRCVCAVLSSAWCTCIEGGSTRESRKKKKESKGRMWVRRATKALGRRADSELSHLRLCTAAALDGTAALAVLPFAQRGRAKLLESAGQKREHTLHTDAVPTSRYYY